MDDRRVCVVCGDAGVPMHHHHILGEAFVPDVWVDVCAWGSPNNCHGELPRLQKDGGVVLDHDVDRSEPETVWTLVAGWAAILSLGVQRHPDPQQRATAALILRCAGSAGLLVDEFSVRFGEGQLRGPDPRGSDVRTAARNRKRTSRRARKRVAAAHGGDQGIFGVLLRALVDSLRSSIASDDACRPVIADLEMFAVNSATLFANLAELGRWVRL